MRVAALGLGILVTACAGSTPEPPRARASLILITCDTLRADRLGCYGYFRDTSPNLDAFARGAIQYERCLTPISLTTPSHLSMLTGVPPYEHGVLANTLQLQGGKGADPFVPTASLQSFAQIANTQGYRTGGFVSAAPLKRVTGVSVGFESWSEPTGERRPGRETVADACAWLDSIGAAPCFLWVHLFEAHGPYTPPTHPPAELLAKFTTDDALRHHLAERKVEAPPGTTGDAADPANLTNLYDASVRELDDRLGELFAELKRRGRFDASTIVVVGDHGQGLLQHHDPGHGSVWFEQLHVPLLVKPAAIGEWNERAARRAGAVGGVVRAATSTTTALPIAVALTPGLDPTPLLRQTLRRGETSTGPDGSPVLFAMVARQRQNRPADALFVGRWKYVRGVDGEQLFDLERDPFELEDVAADVERDDPATLAQLRARLDAELVAQTTRRQQFSGGATPASDAAALEQLRRELEKLGYTTGDDE
jgi:arylsulfatase